jgi:septal ring factor EnvC (AmiA/AmiB activator)
MHARPPQSTTDAVRRGCIYSALILAGQICSPVAAQTAAPPVQNVAAYNDALKQREQELEAARIQQKNSAEQQAKLKAEIAAIGEDRSKLNQQLIDIAARVRDVEGRIADTETRLQALDGREQEIRSSLASRRSEVVEVLAALQRAGRRTPPALLVRP